MTDTEIINWLESHLWAPNPRFGYGSLSGNLDLAEGASLRAAIEKAAARNLEVDPEARTRLSHA